MTFRFLYWLSATFKTSMQYPPDHGLKKVFIARAQILSLMFVFFFILFGVLELGTLVAP